MIVRELITVLGFDADERPLEKINSGVSRLKKSLTALAAIGTAVSGALYAVAQSTANAGDDAAKTGQAIGLTAEQVQEYRHAADLSGVSSEDLTTSLRRVSQAARDAARGTGTAKDTLDELGISLTGADGKLKTTDQMVEAIADRFQKLPNGPEKTAAAMDLFGRSGAKMIAMLNAGGDGIREMRQEARDLGVVIDNDTAAATEEFNDTLYRLKQFLTGLKHLAGAEIIPIFIENGKAVLEWAKANKNLIRERVKEFVEALIKAGKSFLTVMKGVAAVVVALSKVMGGLENVIKFVTIAMMAFVAMNIVGSIMGVVEVVLGLIGAMKSLGVQGALAWLKAFFPVAGVIAGILAVVLILEDLVGWAEGKDSIFGRLFPGLAFEQIKEKITWIMIALGALIGLIALVAGGWVIAVVAAVAVAVATFAAFYDDMVDWTADAIGAVVDYFKGLGDDISTIFDFVWNGVKSGFKSMVDGIMRMINPLLDKLDTIKGGASRVLDTLKFWENGEGKSGAQLAGEYVGGGAAGPQVDARRRVNQVQNSRSQNVSVGEVAVNIQGSTNMSPAELAQATQAGIDQALRRQVENASESFDGEEDF